MNNYKLRDRHPHLFAALVAADVQNDLNNNRCSLEASIEEALASADNILRLVEEKSRGWKDEPTPNLDDDDW